MDPATVIRMVREGLLLEEELAALILGNEEMPGKMSEY